MDTNSWMRLAAQDPRWQLPEDLRALDPRGGRDCGWVEQMTPFITHFTRPGDWVLDPFCGFGSTLVAASLAGVPAVGLDVDAQRVGISRARLDALGLDARAYPVWQGSVAAPATQGRCRDELSGAAEAAACAPDGPRGQARVGLCLTNIPYFGCDPVADDASAQLYGVRHYEPYLQGIREVFEGVHAVLAPGAWCVVMAQNLRLGGRFVPLAWDVARLLGERFVLHEERVLIYDRAGDPARVGSGGASATNRAHEYALVCRKEPRGLDVEAGRALLDALRQDGFDYLVYGSFAACLAPERCADAPPMPPMPPANDIDLIVPPDGDEVSRLLRWFEQHGFRIESWNAQVRAPVSVAALAYRHYLRARRVDALGNDVQVDVTVAQTRAAYDAERVERAERAPSAARGPAGLSAAD
jgi:hypothetical protein